MTHQLRNVCLFATLAIFPVALPPAFAASITGTVTNKTTNKPAAGDDVVLIKLAQGMQESTRTKTDSRGRFTLDVPDEGIHLVRVTHDKANYFRPAPPGTQSVELEVFNAAAKVAGVTGEADVMRIQSDPGGSGLRVVENFFVKNESTPPMTQFSDRPFEFYLPAGAIVEGSAALAPGGMPVQAAPVPLGDAPNHYAFIFPIRPGETRFQITYKLPYTGSFKFAPRPVMPTDTLAVMMPKSMKFAAGPSTSYTAVTEDTTAQTNVARNIQPSQPLDFTVSGEGQLPRDPAPGATGTGDTPSQGVGQTGAAPATAATDTRPGGGLGTPIDPEGTNDPWAKYKWWILGGLGLALAAGAGVLLKAPTAKPAAIPEAPVATGPGALLQTLKDELFAIETERLQGKLTDAQYAEQKVALETVLRRALNRARTDSRERTDSLMATLLRAISLLTIVIWVGGIAFFAFVLAPVAFHVLPTTHEAGLVVGGTLTVLDRIGLVSGMVFLLAAILQRPRAIAQIALVAAMIALTAALEYGILPRMERDRASAGGDITLVAPTSPARADFDRLPPLSEKLEGAVLLAGLAVVVLLAAEPGRQQP